MNIELQEIGDYAFSACGLTHIFIPDSVSKIGKGAFNNCELKEVHIKNPELLKEAKLGKNVKIIVE